MSLKITSEPLTYIDRSLTNLAGTSEALMAANPRRKLLLIHNPSAASIAVNLTGGAAALATGGSVQIPTNGTLLITQHCPQGAITVIGTATQDVTAFEAQ